jgi:hypothetical protein
MTLNYALLKQNGKGRLSSALLTLALLLICVGALLAAVATKKFQVQTSVDITLCQADGQGGWKVIDNLRGSASFEATPTELASGNEYTTHQPWIARSEKGCQVSGRTTRPVVEKWDKTSGEYQLTLPVELTVNGQTINLTLLATTETISTPIGSISGQRATWANNTLSAALVGVVKFRANPGAFNCNRSVFGNRGNSQSNNAAQDFAAVVKTSGRATARD